MAITAPLHAISLAIAGHTAGLCTRQRGRLKMLEDVLKVGLSQCFLHGVKRLNETTLKALDCKNIYFCTCLSTTAISQQGLACLRLISRSGEPAQVRANKSLICHSKHSCRGREHTMYVTTCFLTGWSRAVAQTSWSTAAAAPAFF